jgi:hypothetical protein
MADSQFPWDELVRLITADQRAVPVIGPELEVLSRDGGIAFDEWCAQRLAERFGLQLSRPAPLAQLAPTLLARGANKAELCAALSQIHREFIAALTPATMPEPLRLLAEIPDFPLFVTTSVDGLLSTAIRMARDRDPGPIAASFGAFVDLPRNWALGPKPTLFHLFGRIGPVPNFAISEEDALEFLHGFQNEAYRPEQLFDELRSRPLLLIGLRFPNWLMRSFIRLLHGTRLSEDTGQIIVLAGDHVGRDAALIGYLREANRRVWIFEDGGAAEFVRELQRRWDAAHQEAWGTQAEGTETPLEPAEMIPGSVYVSCSRGDLPAAERLATTLDRAGLDVWFDRNPEPQGFRYERRIRQYLRECDLFIPLLSPELDKQPGAFFRKEWEWAVERAEILGDRMRFILPLAIDHATTTPAAPAALGRFPVHRAPGGQAEAEYVQSCVEAVRRMRTLRRA